MAADEATAVQEEIAHALAALEADLEKKRGLIRELTTALEKRNAAINLFRELGQVMSLLCRDYNDHGRPTETTMERVAAVAERLMALEAEE